MMAVHISAILQTSILLLIPEVVTLKIEIGTYRAERKRFEAMQCSARC
jgi:hypothetical protein